MRPEGEAETGQPTPEEETDGEAGNGKGGRTVRFCCPHPAGRHPAVPSSAHQEVEQKADSVWESGLWWALGQRAPGSFQLFC